MSADHTRPAGARRGLHPSPNALLRTFLFGLRALLYVLIVAETVLLAYVIAALA